MEGKGGMNVTCCEKHTREHSGATESLAVKAARLADALDQGMKSFLAAGEKSVCPRSLVQPSRGP